MDVKARNTEQLKAALLFNEVDSMIIHIMGVIRKLAGSLRASSQAAISFSYSLKSSNPFPLVAIKEDTSAFILSNIRTIFLRNFKITWFYSNCSENLNYTVLFFTFLRARFLDDKLSAEKIGQRDKLTFYVPTS